MGVVAQVRIAAHELPDLAAPAIGAAVAAMPFAYEPGLPGTGRRP